MPEFAIIPNSLGIRDYLPLGNRTIQIIGPIREEDVFEVARQYNWQLNAIQQIHAAALWHR